MHARGGQPRQHGDSVSAQSGGDGSCRGLDRRPPGVADMLRRHRAVDAVGKAVHDTTTLEDREL